MSQRRIYCPKYMTKLIQAHGRGKPKPIRVTALPWSENEIILLRRMYRKCSWAEILSAFPGRSKMALKCQAHRMVLSRPRRLFNKTGIYLFDEIFDRAMKHNFTLKDLNDEAGTVNYFNRAKRPRYIRVDAIEAALQALGGELNIRWHDD